MASFGYPASNDWSQNFVPSWQPSWNSSSAPAPMQIRYHTGVENLAVEETYKRNQPQVVPINDNTVFHSKYPSPNVEHRAADSKNVKDKRKDGQLREGRFIGVPLSSKSSNSGHFGFASPFFIEIRKYLNLEPDALPSKTPAMVPTLVEKAAQGIIEEGKQLGKDRKAERIASMLRQKKNAGMEEVWKECVYYYTSTNFLYKSLNSTVKIIGDKGKENIWKSKVPTLGPFCLLLSDNPFKKGVTKNKTIYRGANMQAAQITQYQDMAKDKNANQSFQVYISCTRNRKKAKPLGNTLFIIEVLNSFTIDLSPYSKYPEEEEELIVPGVSFHVKSVTFDQKKNRHLINLELRQKLSST